MNTKHDFFAAARKRRLTQVSIEGLGSVYVREPDGATDERLQAADYTTEADGRVRFNPAGHAARWIIACVTDEQGKPLFTDKDAAEIEALPAEVLKALADQCEAVARSTPSAVQDAAKN